MRRGVVVVTIVLAGTVGLAFGQGLRNWRATLSGFEETAPGTISTVASGSFSAEINHDETVVSWTLSYEDLEGTVQQAHIHFGAAGTSGGISVFLCTNQGNGPPGTQPCPPSPATVTGTFAASDVIGPPLQGIDRGEFDELLRAIRAGMTYANVHSARFPQGEVRGQIRASGRAEHTH
jgi:hypothetical protein